MYSRLKEVGKKFKLFGELFSYEPITMGNINSTYKVTYDRGDGVFKSYLFQRVNTHVFKNPVEIMENIDRVTSHIREKRPGQVSLHYHHTDEGLNYYACETDAFWRVVNFVDAVTFNSTNDCHVLAATGKAFGQFAGQLVDFDASQLHETIPYFHDTRMRLDTFFTHVEEDVCGRCEEVREEIDQIREARAFVCKLNEMVNSGELPLRVTHNDTKANNVLFDKETLEPLVVIDLDTVMPGLAAHDFGDAVRFAANTAMEDEADVSKVALNLDLFRAIAEGYIGAIGDMLTPPELESMALGVVTITLELASRFLDDYITGDKYFKTLYPGHNLVRARCQLALYADMMGKYEDMNAIVRECVEKAKG